MTVDPPQKWGPILLVGGSGRLGYFVSRELLRQPECDRVVSINRNEKVANPCDGVEYRAADLRDYATLTHVLHDVKPETIINLAAPAHANTLTPKSEFEDVFVKAQHKMIELAREVGTRFIVSTTSANVAAGYEHINVDETSPLWPEDSPAFAYWVQRAKAETLLLAADSPALQTVSLRLPLIIGERDYAFVPSMVKSMKEGNTTVQVGDDKGLLATVSAGDAARGHVLALRALRKPSNNVHGEAFYIIGKDPLSFWSMARIVWNEAGWKQEKKPMVMPRWVAQIIASSTETIMRPFGKEPQLSTHVLRFMCNSWTYDGTKARDRLGYVPDDEIKDQLEKGVRWHLKDQPAS